MGAARSRRCGTLAAGRRVACGPGDGGCRLPAPGEAILNDFGNALWRWGLRLAYRGQLLYWFVFRPRIEGAYVAVWHGDRVLVIRNSYRRRLSLPAGGLKRGERPDQAAARELFEEVGIAAEPGALRFARKIVSTNGYAEDHAHFFELRLDAPCDPRIDGREVVWAAFLTRDEAIASGVVSVVRLYLSEPGPEL